MRIGELTKATGIDVETLRYYERVGLLQLPARQANGYRTYGQDAVEQGEFYPALPCAGHRAGGHQAVARLFPIRRNRSNRSSCHASFAFHGRNQNS
ncbi:MAG: MerR family DNA-binding transcriptional regulator [Gallionella sp.]